MMANNCFEDILQCNQEVTILELMKNMYLPDLFQINTKINLQLIGFCKLLLCNFSFHCLGC